ncbi:hypothetical protein B4U79_19018 [Dinothrombium tinctorium]|uniref:Uncharacterized protein n=1 Tax=Dinothrombium tinctorium TaxID=1965070 RepID=A0A3S3S247_9ACAR|nr:hypothetical protein B4U79_19018 [Dinothrombium tinctorium]
MDTIDSQSDECGCLYSLNDGLLLAICLHLTNRDLLSLRLVSKSVKIVSDRILSKRKKQIFVGDVFNRAKLEFVSKFYSNGGRDVTIALLHRGPHLTKIISILSRNIERIENLKFYHCFNDEHLLLISQSFPHLKYLMLNFRVDQNAVTDNGISLMLLNLPNLQNFHLSKIESEKSPSSTSHFYNALIELMFYATRGTLKISEASFQAFASIQYLNDLFLDEIDISANEFSILMEATAQKLRQLKMFHTYQFGNASFYLQEIFNKCTKLECLYFSFKHSTVKNLKLMNISSLKQIAVITQTCEFNHSSEILANVEKLVLSIRALDDQQLDVMSRFPNVKNLTLILSLRLAFTNISDLINLPKIEIKDGANIEDITRIMNTSPNCAHFVIHKQLDAELLYSIFDIHGGILKEDHNKIIAIQFASIKQIAFRQTLPTNLKLVFF